MRKSILVASVVGALAAGPALAEPIGTVKKASGEASLERAGSAVTAQPGVRVEEGDVLVTGDDASLGVTLDDGTLISAGPNTRLSVADFAYQPPGGDHSMVANITQGTLAYLSGQIALFSDDAVSVKVPAGTIAVRGTHFVVKVEPAR